MSSLLRFVVRTSFQHHTRKLAGRDPFVRCWMMFSSAASSVLRPTTRLLYGEGTNDADYKLKTMVNGKRKMCPYYDRWHNMLRRCYHPKTLERRPTYKEYDVCEDWKSFMSFRMWMITQKKAGNDWEGRHLSMRVLVKDSKVYSPETCIFVPVEINCLFMDRAAARGEYKQGVSWHKARGKFRAEINKYGEEKHIGYYVTEDEAHIAYLAAKGNYVKEIANALTVPYDLDRLRPALLVRAEHLLAYAQHLQKLIDGQHC